MGFIQKQGHWKSENGWRMCDTAELDYGAIPGTNFKLGVRKGAPSIILKSVIWRLNKIEPMITSQIGCYTDTNSMSNSNHNSATAIDYNWGKHPWKKVGTWGNLQGAVNQIVADFKQIVEWGGHWSVAYRDDMHFELHFAEGHAGTEAFANDLRNGLWGIWKPGSPPTEHIPGPDDILEIGDTGPEVLKLQQGMNAVFRSYKAMPLQEDSIFGPKTESAVIEFQQRSLIGADGMVGPVTKAKLAEYGILLSSVPAPTKPPVIVPQKVWPQTASDRELLEYVAEQVGPGHATWPTKGKTQRDKLWEIAERMSNGSSV